MRVQILRMLALMMLGVGALADERGAVTPPPGVPAAGPDSAPLPDGVDSPAYDAIRQRCAVALDRRACIEAAQRTPPVTRPDKSSR